MFNINLKSINILLLAHEEQNNNFVCAGAHIFRAAFSWRELNEQKAIHSQLNGMHSS